MYTDHCNCEGKGQPLVERDGNLSNHGNPTTLETVKKHVIVLIGFVKK